MAGPGPFASVNDLGLKMLQLACNKEIPTGGIIVSPASIGIALAMLAGAAIPSESEKMCTALGSDKPESLDALYLSLKDCKDTTAAANAIFAKKGTKLDKEYASFLQQFAVLTNTEFPRLIDGLDTINTWITNNTMGMIKDMIKRESVLQSHIVLVNALSYKGTWKEQFNPKDTTRKYPFQVSESETRPVDMMFRLNEHILVYEAKNYTAIQLPYQASSPAASTSFMAYLPHPGTSVQQVLSSIPPLHGKNRFTSEKFDRFGFPKMETSSGMDILPLFRQIGFHIPGDFPKMGMGGNVVQSILHNTAISLDEKGTRAAASTAVMMMRCIRTPKNLIFNRPFVFSIVIDSTGAALFTGVFSPES
ncbi:proteinase inhibitor I4 [Arthroderma uncinatum]|uniref:proteinase inhibitor I4 n=1 Tax=Arthroderma uncinatum TaxID=74035 RepID=UPI00144A997A|nr:proteinase inhibitor I4 [Arthroderma uncinatum]KAF3490680.1 proteinase inhibitor I4 [Arthroderma uncinatum]